MPNKKAARAPVHPPVTGKGIATRIKSPHAPYFSILSFVFLLVLLNNQSKNFFQKLNFDDKKWDTFSRKKIKIIGGIILPKTAQK